MEEMKMIEFPFNVSVAVFETKDGKECIILNGEKENGR